MPLILRNTINRALTSTEIDGNNVFLDSTKLNKTGDSVSLATNGLQVGTNQIVTNASKVGIGGTPTAPFHVFSDTQIDGAVSGTGFAESVQDVVGGMVGSNTETGLTVTYDDSSGKLNFNVNDPTITLTGDMTGSSTITNLSNTSIATALRSITVTGTNAVARNLYDKLSDFKTILDFGAVPDGITECGVFIQNALNSGNKTIYVPDGNYLVSTDIIVPFAVTLIFGRAAIFLAGANNLAFFKITTSTSLFQIINPRLNGNTKTGVIGFDFSNVGNGVISFPRLTGMTTGIYLRTLVSNLIIETPIISTVTNGIIVSNGSSGVQIRHPTVSGYTGVAAIDISNGVNPTYNVNVTGGFMTMGAIGIRDAGIATKITGTRFDANTVADISLISGSVGFSGSTTNHTGTGTVAYLGRNADSANINHPIMLASARTTGLFDFDGSNTNCTRFNILGAASINTPIGTTTGIDYIPVNITGAFTPTIVGSTSAGTATYTVQKGIYSKIGNVIEFVLEIAWSSHTGTGNLRVSGLPLTGFSGSNALATFNVLPENITYTGSISAIPISTTSIELQTYSSGASKAPLAIDADGSLQITGKVLI
jgi:hypothetical protein